MICRICESNSDFFARAKILNKYEVSYFRCVTCGFVQTEEPYWFAEAYSEVINRGDIGLVGRNIILAKISKAVISVFFDLNAKFIDYGGGYGLFVRLMRDAGFDFYRYDRYCENLFAKDFEAESVGNDQYELLTAFEIFEHLVNPLEEMENMLAFSKNILFSTVIIPANTPKPDEWWYYGLDHGQHISFFTQKALLLIAERFSLNLYSDGKFLHLLTSKKIFPFMFKVICNNKVTTVINLLVRRKSLIAADYKKTNGKELT